MDLQELQAYGHFLFGLRPFFKKRLSYDQSRDIVRRRLEERENSFIQLIERGIFGNPKSPYYPLLKMAQCEMGDLHQMVHSLGLEPTLKKLREAGVYITFEEFKGQSRVVRPGVDYAVHSKDFDNPYLSNFYYAQSGGSTGAGTRTAIDLDHLVATAPNYQLGYHAHGVQNVQVGIWRSILPSSAGINNGLRASLIGSRLERWFTPSMSDDLKPTFKYRCATRTMLLMARLSGVRIPNPEPVSFNEAIKVARWASATAKAEGGCLIRTFVSLGMRVCIAAMEEGIDLNGVTLMGGGEPLTPAKYQCIIKSGARFIPNYVISEMGPVGMGCVNPLEPNDLHFFADSHALFQYPRKVPGFDIEVPAFYFTSLLPTAPKLLLNVESDDYGIMENRSCGCEMERYGWNVHLRGIRSFRKLTGEGMTLVGSEMEHILENILPNRFGGSPLDYQLAEEEDEQSFTRLKLIIHPDIQIESENDVIHTVIDSLHQGSPAAGLASSIWSQGNTIRIKRAKPIWTSHGKLLPLHLNRMSKMTPPDDWENTHVSTEHE